MNSSAPIKTAGAISPDLGHGQPSQPSSNHQDHPGSEERPPSEQHDYRLLIEEGEVAGSLLYKTIDRKTGDVVAERPSEQVAHLGETADYHAGDVIKTQA